MQASNPSPRTTAQSPQQPPDKEILCIGDTSQETEEEEEEDEPQGKRRVRGHGPQGRTKNKERRQKPERTLPCPTRANAALVRWFIAVVTSRRRCCVFKVVVCWYLCIKIGCWLAWALFLRGKEGSNQSFLSCIWSYPPPSSFSSPNPTPPIYINTYCTYTLLSSPPPFLLVLASPAHGPKE